MPGYQPVRILQPSDYYSKHEPIYGHAKSKKKSKGPHPLFQELKTRDSRERMNYERYLMSREMVRGNPNGNKGFDSLKLLGSCNDINYLDTFMSMPRERRPSTQEEPEPRLRSRSIAKSSSTVLGKGEKKNGIHNDSSAVTAAMLSSLRSAGSEDNLYESMEMIHYLKTKQTLNRQKKTRSLQKTGHPLFDHLREEQAMKEPIRKISSSKKTFDEQALQGLRQEYMTSDGNSPSHSSSSSGDEYDIYPRMVVKSSKGSRPKMMHPMPERSHMEQHLKRQEKQRAHQKKTKHENNGSESDDEFKIIPRPKLMGRALLMHQQQQQQLKLQKQQQQQKQRRRSDVSPPSEESDSSFNAALLR